MQKRSAVIAVSTLAWIAGCSGASSPPPTMTQITLSSSAATVNLNGSVTLTATLSGSSAGSVIGVVTFYDGTTRLQANDVTGKITTSAIISNLAPGANSLTAAYGGDQTHATSVSPAVIVNVNVPTTTTIAASPALAGTGDPVTLTAVVAAGTYAPSGTVTFASGGTTLGTASLASVGGAQTATLVTTGLPLGTDSITATYASNNYFLGSQSGSASVLIHTELIHTATVLSTSPATTIPSGTPTTLTATITPASGSIAPTGTVNFLDGTTSLGTAVVSGNVATLQTRQFKVGSNSLTAVYSGDGIYSTSSSPVTPITMSPYTGASYSNPLNVTDPATGKVFNCPDPAIIKAQTGGANVWYAYCTGDAFNSADTASGGAFKAHLISILSSTDLVNWTYVRDAFSALPSWIAPGNELQTPAIKFFNGLYHLYYEAPSVAASPNGSAIGVGTAVTPDGPFTDHGSAVVEQQTACGGGCNRTVFSPEVLADQSGQLWIVYGGIFAGLSVRQLSADGFTSSLATEINIGVDNYYQDPFLLYKDGYFYEFATAGACCGGAFSTYNVHVGRSTSITGPYLDAEGNDMNAYSAPATVGAPGGDPVLVMNGNDIAGAGSNSVFTDESGQDYILYSGVSKQQQYLPNVTGYTARQLMLDALDWVGGWPVTRSGEGPSDFTTPQPLPAAQPGATNGYVPAFATPDTPAAVIAASSDDFNTTTLGKQWSFLHGTPAYTLTGTSYSVQSANAESTVNMSSLPILAEAEPAGNYMMEVKISFNVPATGCCNFNYAQAGVFIYSSDAVYLRLDEFADFDTRQIEFLNQFGPGALAFAPVGTPNFAGNTWLRIVKRVGSNGAPDTYTSYSSIDGVTFLKGPAWTASFGSTAQIGLFSGNLPGFTASFDYIHVTQVAP